MVLFHQMCLLLWYDQWALEKTGNGLQVTHPWRRSRQTSSELSCCSVKWYQLLKQQLMFWLLEPVKLLALAIHPYASHNSKPEAADSDTAAPRVIIPNCSRFPHPGGMLSYVEINGIRTPRASLIIPCKHFTFSLSYHCSSTTYIERILHFRRVDDWINLIYVCIKHYKWKTVFHKSNRFPFC